MLPTRLRHELSRTLAQVQVRGRGEFVLVEAFAKTLSDWCLPGRYDELIEDPTSVLFRL